jgi:hypothetical protein
MTRILLADDQASRRRTAAAPPPVPWSSPVLLVIAMALTACTTYVKPTTCEAGSTACGGLHDARFCEYRAVAVEGMDCANLAITPSHPFCVVTTQACIETHYSVKGRDCRVLRYDRMLDSARDECPRDVPMFVNR